MKIAIRVKIDEKYLKEVADNGSVFFEDGSKVDRKKINNVQIICDSCESPSVWNSLPSREYLTKSKFLCRSCRQIGDKNSQFGRKWTDERKTKKSEEMTGEKNHMYKKSFFDVWVEKYGVIQSLSLLEEHKLKSKRVSEENGMYGKKFYDVWLGKYGKEKADILLLDYRFQKSKWLRENPEHHNQMIINSHIKKYKKTSIEKTIESYLRDKKIIFKYNFILNNKYQFDFYLKDYNLIIETHGDYWHANPIYYSDIDKDKKKLNETQRYKVGIDKLKNDYALENGYQIVYLWETDIKNENYKNILQKWNL